MIKLPTQFDARARQQIDTAAAGGSTSTCCSSCVVTLGSAVVASSMYFAHLRKRAGAMGAEEGATNASDASSNPWAATSGNAQADSAQPVQAPRSVELSDAAALASEQAAVKGLTDSTWFWVVMAVVALIVSPLFGEGVVLLAVLAIAVMTLTGWVKAHLRAGVGAGQAILIGVVSIALLLGAIVLEAMAWLGAL